MKANACARSSDDDRAEVGIGTLIVFIAAVLVAAVAAAVLINTSGKLQQRGQVTGQEATQQVSSNLQLFNVWASRSGTSGDMKWLNVTIGTAAGSFSIDLAKASIVVSDGVTLKNLTYVNGAAGNTQFNASKIADADNSWSTATPVMNSGDLVNVMINLDTVNGNSMTLAPSEALKIKILPGTGAPLLADIDMPSTFGTDSILEVR